MTGQQNNDLVFHEIASNPLWSGFALQRGFFEYIHYPDSYMPQAFQKQGTLIGQGVEICYRIPPAKREGLYEEISVSSVSGRKPANPKRALDVWTDSSQDHIVSEKGRKFIESVDPRVHSFDPVKLLNVKDKARFGDVDYFIWRNGRSLKIEMQEMGPDVVINPELKLGPRDSLSDPIARFLHTLCFDVKVWDEVRQLPIWTLLPLNIIFVNEDVFRQATELKLKGFELGEGLQRRNAARISLPLLPDPRKSSVAKIKKSLWSRLTKMH